MPFLFQQLLIWHVVIGLAGIMFFVLVLLELFGTNIGTRKLKILSFFGFASFIASWIMGGYYYVMYYGGAVKPVIKAGDYPWVHGIIMESKEHIFLFLPILAAVAFLIFWLGDNLASSEPRLKRALTALVLLIIVYGVFVAVSGTVISGAVR